MKIQKEQRTYKGDTMMSTTEVWLAYFEKHAKLKENSTDIHLDNKEVYLVYLF